MVAEISHRHEGGLSMEYVELHCHTHYSLLDAASSPMELLLEQKRKGSSALAITDHNTLRGVPAFLRAAKAVGVRPIIGCELNVEAELGGHSSITHLVLLVANIKGLHHLQELVGMANEQGAVTKKDLRIRASGLIALSGCLAGEIPRLSIFGDEQRAGEAVREYQEIFGKENFYLEVQNHGLLEEDMITKRLLELSETCGAPLVATNDVHYALQEDQPFHDLLLCLQQGCTMQDEDRMSFPSKEYDGKGAEEMRRLFRDCPEAVEDTTKIAERCLEDEDLRRFLNMADEHEMEQRFGQTVVDATGDAKSISSSVAKDYDQRHAKRFARIVRFTDITKARREVARVFGPEDESMAEKLCRMAQEICDGN